MYAPMPFVPADPTGGEATTRRPTEANPPGQAPHPAGPRVLVIAHKDEDVTLIRQALAPLDPWIDWAPDEAAAWRYLSAGRTYDLLVLLLPLPQADALAACRRLRAADERRPIMLVATTRALATETEVLAGFEAGADACVTAPLSAVALCARAVALLRRSGGAYRPLPLPGAVHSPVTPADRAQPVAATGAPAARAPVASRAAASVAHTVQRIATAPLTRRTRTLLAAALIVAGIAGDRAVQALQPSAAAAATTTAATTAQAATQTTSSALDAAIERAFAIASPSVVYVDNVGVGTGSGVIYHGGAAQGIGFAVPGSRVTYIAHQIIATGRVAHTGRAYLGVGATDARQAQSQAQGFFGSGGSPATSATGALVESVSGPAAQAGVRQGAVITAFDGTAISGEDDLLAVLARSKPGDTVTLRLDRSGAALNVRVHLGEMPASS